MSGEYEFEPVPGLPETLPAGEALLWQGSPNWKNLAFRALHLRGTAIYFALLLLWYTESKLTQGNSWSSVLMSDLRLGALATLTLGLMGFYAWWSARTTIYTITSRRVVMRAGVALPMVLNLPFTRIEAVNLKSHAHDSGDIALTLSAADRVAYLMLWPHVRPWRLARAQPMLRGLPDAAAAAAILGEVLAAESGSTSTAPQADWEPAAAPKLTRRPQAAALA
jgi:hypothetical protein